MQTLLSRARLSPRSAVAGRSRLGGRFVIAIAIALVSLLSYYGMSEKNPVTNEKQHINLSVDQEIALGLDAAPEMAAQMGGLSSDERARARVAAIGRRIVEQSAARESPYRYDFHLLADPRTINAFALPGGQVFITEGLYSKLDTEGQLAGVLGHEVGHVVARHAAEHIAKAQLTQGLTGAAVIATYDPDHPSSRNTAAMAALIGGLVNMRFSRQDELESDRLGVRFITESGYDPRAMIRVMKVLEAASDGGRQPEFFSTHPNPEHRIQAIEEAIREQFPSGLPSNLES